MRCLVTGVAGFIGSHLAERLLADGHEVCGIDNFLDYYPRFIKEDNLRELRLQPHFTFVEGNLLDMDLQPYLAKVSWIFHQAAQPGVRASWGKDFARYTDCNVLVTQRLLELALHARDLKRFVYASSSSVYGDAHVLPLAESALPRPLSPYGVTTMMILELNSAEKPNSQKVSQEDSSVDKEAAMNFLELHYMTARGAGVCRYLWDELSALKAVKSLVKRHVEARLINPQTREEAGIVEETSEGKWVWWFDSAVFKGQPSTRMSQSRAKNLASSSTLES